MLPKINKMQLSTAQFRRAARGINLAGSAPSEALKIARVQSVVKRTSFIVLGVYLAALVAVVGTHFFFLSQERKLVSQGNILKKDIGALSFIETLLATVKSRTAAAGNILTNSPSAPEKLLTEVISLLPASSSISEVSTEEGKILISVRLPDSRIVTQLFRSVSLSQFTNIYLDGLSLTTGGIYTATLSIQ